MKLIDATRDYLKTICPKASNISVKVIRTKTGEFLSKIDITTPWKVLHAQKVEATPYKSIEKSMKAMNHQVDRLKERHRYKGSMGLESWY